MQCVLYKPARYIAIKISKNLVLTSLISYVVFCLSAYKNSKMAGWIFLNVSDIHSHFYRLFFIEQQQLIP